jgi:nitrite reductase (NADH) small subunit
VKRVADEMAEFQRMCSVAELPAEGTAKELYAGGRALCVVRMNGEISAMDNVCPHRGAPLAEGTVEEGRLICPWHAWAFDPRTGQADESAEDRVRIYEIKLDGNDVYARV